MKFGRRPKDTAAGPAAEQAQHEETMPRSTSSPGNRGRSRRSSTRTPGQRAGLTREEVVAAARGLADREGVERVTMRRLAGELGVAPNALYTYFRDKTAILDAVFDDVLGELEPPSPGAGAWQDALAELMRASRRLLLAHPRLATLFLTRPGGPNAMRLGEVALRILERGGIRGRVAVEALRALLAYTLGSAAMEAPRRVEPERGERLERAAALIEHLPEDAYALTRASSRDLATHPSEEDFERGLRWLIRGIEAEAGSIERE